MSHTHTIIHPDPIVETKPEDVHRPISWSWSSADTYADAKPYLAQRIFGTLVQLAQPIVERYHSDLFWDADLVNRIEGETEFYYTVRDNGTHFSPDRDHLESIRSNWPNGLSWRIRLWMGDRGTWYLEASPYEWVPGRA